MTATWPAGLPQLLLIEGYREGFADGRLRSETETGPGKVRARTSARPRPVSGTMQMTSDQIVTLESFVATDLAKAVRPFIFPNPRGGTWLVRLGEALPSWDNLGGDTYRVALTLEILP